MIVKGNIALGNVRRGVGVNGIEESDGYRVRSGDRDLKKSITDGIVSTRHWEGTRTDNAIQTSRGGRLRENGSGGGGDLVYRRIMLDSERRRISVSANCVRSGFPNPFEWKPRGQPSPIAPPSHRSKNNMGIRDFLRIPRKNRRARSEARNEANPVEGRPVDLVAPPQSQPNLGIGSSISRSTSVPPTTRSQEPSGM